MYKDKIIFCTWGYSMTIVDYYRVLKETEKSLLVEQIKSKTTRAAEYLAGYSIPEPKIIPDTREKPFRIYKRENGKEVYFVSSLGGYRKYFYVWDGKEKYFNHCD
jgi:hypothetical protein